MIGILDAAQARAFRLDTAALRNGAGSFVGPTDPGFAAALPAMTVNADGVTRQVGAGTGAKAAYPLTTLTVAAVRRDVSGDSKTGALAFLAYATGAGQVPGYSAGQPRTGTCR